MLGVQFFSGLNAYQVAVAISVVLPLLVAVITKYTASPALKGVTLAVLAAVGGVVSALISTNPPPFTIGTILAIGFPIFVGSVGVYFGFWKPVLNPSKVLAPRFGLGREKDLPLAA